MCAELAGCHRACDLHGIELDSSVLDDSAVADAGRPDGEPLGCPDTYSVRLPTTASLYRVVATHASWTSARLDCADDVAPTGSKTHLVVWSNMAERDATRGLLVGETWIGATSRKVATYAWVTDEDTGGYVVPVTRPTPQMPSPLPWEPDQPDNVAIQCAESRISAFLHDEDCGDASAYICECDDRPEVPANF